MSESEDWELRLTGRQRSNIKKIKGAPHYADMRARGFTPYTPEWRKECTRLRMRGEKYKANKRPYVRAKYQQDLEKNREINRLRKKTERERRNEEIKAKQKERYQRNRTLEAAKQRVRRWSREPNRAIRTLTDLYIQGLLSDEQYIERIDGYIEAAKQITGRKSTGK